MADGIHESLVHMAVDIDALVPLHNNPRHGDVEAIMSSYLEFGQIKPIVIRPNDDGTATVIAGNHQLEAARRLGWNKIAAVQYDVDDTRAMAFAIADNRTMELGYTEPEMLNEVILELADVYPELIDGLGWDEFATAEIEQRLIREERAVIEPGAGFIPPVIVSSDRTGFDDEPTEVVIPLQPPAPRLDTSTVSLTQTDDGKQRIDIKPGIDQRDAVVRGSTTVSSSGSPQAVVQYTIVFDNPNQQSRWYGFIKWLKADPAIDGTTIGQRLIDFIGQHTEA